MTRPRPEDFRHLDAEPVRPQPAAQPVDKVTATVTAAVAAELARMQTPAALAATPTPPAQPSTPPPAGSSTVVGARGGEGTVRVDKVNGVVSQTRTPTGSAQDTAVRESLARMQAGSGVKFAGGDAA